MSATDTWTVEKHTPSSIALAPEGWRAVFLNDSDFPGASEDEEAEWWTEPIVAFTTCHVITQLRCTDGVIDERDDGVDVHGLIWADDLFECAHRSHQFYQMLAPGQAIPEQELIQRWHLLRRGLKIRKAKEDAKA